MVRCTLSHVTLENWLFDPSKVVAFAPTLWLSKRLIILGHALSERRCSESNTPQAAARAQSECGTSWAMASSPHLIPPHHSGLEDIHSSTCYPQSHTVCTASSYCSLPVSSDETLDIARLLVAPRISAHAPSIAMADHAEPASGKKDAAPAASPLQSLSNSVSSIGRTPPPALKMSSSPNPQSSHRSSFAEHMRGAPTSPRATRQPSLSQQALQELLNNPPTKGGDPRFQGRDWKTIRLGEIVDRSLVRFVEYDTSVEDATSVSRYRLRCV